MIRAVLDTNVLASGLAGLDVHTSASGAVLGQWLAGRGAGSFELVIWPHILDELERTMAKPYFRTHRSLTQIEAAQQFVAAVATFVVPDAIVSGSGPHPADDLVLAAAVTAGAGYLVTGDKRFLAVGSHAGVTILSPRAFLAVLGAENP